MTNHWRTIHGQRVERHSDLSAPYPDDLDMASGVAVGTMYAIGLTLLLAAIAWAALKAKGVI